MDKFNLPRLLITTVAFWLIVTLLSLDSVNILNGYVLVVIERCLIFVILASSLNLVNGIIGQFSMGHMGFAAVGAYVSGTITTLWLKLPPPDPGVWISFPILIFMGAIIVGGVFAAGVGLLIGFPSLRLKGDYLAIVTLGFGEIIRTILNNIDYVGGPRGLLGIPKFSSFTIICLFALLVIVLLRNLVHCSHGRAMLSIRENELASELCGVDTTRYKVMGFVIGAFCAGIGGGLLAHLLTLAHPTQFGFMPSALVLIMVYAGGMGSITGSIVAAFTLTILSEGLRSAIDYIPVFKIGAMTIRIGTEWVMVVYAVLLILIMLYRTEGIMGMREAKLLIIEDKQ